jgi:hypothetical protein
MVDFNTISGLKPNIDNGRRQDIVCGMCTSGIGIHGPISQSKSCTRSEQNE